MTRSITCVALAVMLAGVPDAADGAPPDGPRRSDPVTLYKAHHVERARENIARHAWAREILAAMVRDASFALQQDRAFFRAFIPELTGWSTYGQVCPACVTEQCAMGESGVLQWSIDRPDELRCKYCGATYPHPDYPETGVLEAPRMGQTYTYYLNEAQRAHPEADPGEHAYRWAGRPVHVSFTGLIRTHKMGWAMTQANLMARLYAVTGDDRYAERTAWILERLAEVFPGYLLHSYGGCFADLPPAEAVKQMVETGRFPVEAVRHPSAEMRRVGDDGLTGFDAGYWGAGRLSTGINGEGSRFLVATVAYDLTRGAAAYTPEMHRRIRDDLFEAGARDIERYNEINNKCPPARAFGGAVGILFEQPDRVRWALEGFRELMAHAFHFDGFCRETPSYSHMYLSSIMNLPELLSGYSDPAGYAAPDGSRIDRFDPFRSVPRYRLALESMERMLTPSGLFPAIGDTHVGDRTPPIYLETLMAHYGPRYAPLLESSQGAPLAEKDSDRALWMRDPGVEVPESAPSSLLRTEYFPDWQVGVLRGGRPADTAFYYNGTRHGGHRHPDTLSIIYHAFGKELATDRGYIWDDPRNAWTFGTPSHNLVVVQAEDSPWNNKEVQSADTSRHSTLEIFAAAPGLEVIQSNAEAYLQCSEYRRTCALVPLENGASYVVDFFRVHGGERHHYSFHGDSRAEAVAGAALQPASGSLYTWLENLRVDSSPPSSWRAAWKIGGTSLHLLMDGPLDRVILGEAPGWRSNRGDQLHVPPIEHIMAERNGNNLRSVYTAVMCAFEGGESPVRGMRRIAPDGEDGTAFGVAVELADRTDYHLSALDDTPRRYGPVTMTGRYGWASVNAQGKVLRAVLVDGTELTLGDFQLTQPEARITRQVLAVDERTLTLDAPLSPDEAPAGRYLLAETGMADPSPSELWRYGKLRTTGFEVEQVNGNQLIVRDYPYEGGRTLVIPQVARYGD